MQPDDSCHVEGGAILYLIFLGGPYDEVATDYRMPRPKP